MLRCSRKHLEEYKNAIHVYLQSKNITDFSKYEISFKDGKLHYIRWEYAIEKPVDITPIPKTVNYYDLYTRKIVLNIPENEETKPIRLNVDGERVSPNYVDRHNRHVQKIIEAFEYVGHWKLIESESIYSNNGVIVINNHAGRRFKGEIHILIMWYRGEDPSLQRTTTTKSVYYTIPKNY